MERLRNNFFLESMIPQFADNLKSLPGLKIDWSRSDMNQDHVYSNQALSHKCRSHRTQCWPASGLLLQDTGCPAWVRLRRQLAIVSIWPWPELYDVHFGKQTIDREKMSADQTANISVTVTNSGTRAGDEVVQMYVHHAVSSVVQPIIVLRGSKRIHLEAGSPATVSFDVGPEQLSFLDAVMRRVVEPGSVELRIGANSVETTSAAVTISE
jgi:hypothetical protein